MDKVFDFIARNFGKIIIVWALLAIAWVAFLVWAIYTLVKAVSR